MDRSAGGTTRLALAFSLVVVLAGTALSDIIRVPTDQPTIALALSIAMPGDIVEVEPGVYYESGLSVPAGVTLRGATGDPNCVVIDGGGEGSVLLMAGKGAANTVKDITIRNGSAAEGGGAFIFDRQVTMINCILTACTALGYGGAIYATGPSCLLDIFACLFIANMAASYDGGAIYANAQAAIILTACLFQGNTAMRYGGALYLYWVTANILRCTFFDNYGEFGGACIGLYATVVPIIACILAFSQWGEAIFAESDSRNVVTLSCTDIFGNPGGDWTPLIADQLGVDGNISEDPQFCSSDGSGDNLSLQSDSPCADCEGEVMGCYEVACGESAATVSTWGQLKLMY